MGENMQIRFKIEAHVHVTVPKQLTCYCDLSIMSGNMS